MAATFDETFDDTFETKDPHIFLDEYFIPGYTGYIPRYIFSNSGKTFGDTTRELIKKNPRAGSRLMPLSHEVHPLIQKTVFRERAGKRGGGDRQFEKNVKKHSCKYEDFATEIQKMKYKCPKHKRKRCHHRQAIGSLDRKRMDIRIYINDEVVDEPEFLPKEIKEKIITRLQKVPEAQKSKSGDKNLGQKKKGWQEFSSPLASIYMRAVDSNLNLPQVPGYMGHIPGSNFVFGQTFGTIRRKLLALENRKKKKTGKQAQKQKHFHLSNIFPELEEEL